MRIKKSIKKVLKSYLSKINDVDIKTQIEFLLYGIFDKEDLISLYYDIESLFKLNGDIIYKELLSILRSLILAS